MNNNTYTAGNRLRCEKSPYLLQHADNPVHWYSWGPEAFLAARQEDKPIFLSIGYSTCHWCHVMSRETFENEAIAQALNQNFISIKVDREERPDVDALYMSACQALTGSGGWPLSILMTPAQEPFWAGTYLPPYSRSGQLGLLELLDEVDRLWRGDRERLLRVGRQAASFLARPNAASPSQPDRALLHAAFEQLRQGFDQANGGFGGAPKFPAPQDLLFLMAYAYEENDPEALEMAETTLRQMARGGIFDQVGGGFCRYSTDERWRIPHFEKMLCDNALLSYTYLDAYARTGKRCYRETACRTLDYALRELLLPGGGFACGEDADSGGEEGAYYYLTREEVRRVLGKTEGESFCNWFAVAPEGAHVPNLLLEPQYDLAWRAFSHQCEALSDYRRSRRGLARDDKVLTSWNALMIAALAKAYRVLGEDKYLRAAESARLFLRTRLTMPDGLLFHRWRDREAAVEGQLEDYAFLCWALLELYEASFSPSCLKDAVQLADRMCSLFWDPEAGGFFRTAGNHQLIARQKESYDGAYPSGNAAAALVLLRLERLTGEPQPLVRRHLEWLAGEARSCPAAHCFSLRAMMDELYPARELVCTCAGEVPGWLAGVGEEYGLAVVVKTAENSRALARIAPYTANYPIPGEGHRFYLCQNRTCSAAVDSLSELRRLLAEEPLPA